MLYPVRIALSAGLLVSAASCSYIEKQTGTLFGNNATTPASESAPAMQADQSFQSTGIAPTNSQPTSPSARVVIESLPPSDPPKSDQVEVLWQIPELPVDTFVLRYGSSPDKLEHTVNIATTDLKEHNDPTHGRVYRYLLKNIPRGETVYVSMASVKNNTQSSFSAPFEVGK